MRGRPGCLFQSARGEADRILLASALSSMHIICPNRVSRRDWIIAVSLCCFVRLCTSSFRTNWYHLMPSSMRRHHWSSASILRASVLDITQQSEPYRNIGKIQLQLRWGSKPWPTNLIFKLCMAARVMALQHLMSQVLTLYYEQHNCGKNNVIWCNCQQHLRLYTKSTINQFLKWTK